MTNDMASARVNTLASEMVADAQHYVTAVTELGDVQDVVANEDIYAGNGMKLLAKGVKLGSRMQEQLIRHKLARPLDHSLSTSPVVGDNNLLNEANKLIAESPLLAAMMLRTGDRLAIFHTLSRIKLPPLLAFKLTVMREQRPAMYQHSLMVAVLCVCIGVRAGASDAELGSHALVGLCHDLGELYTDPSLLATENVIQADERRFIYVHPITGYLILNEFLQFDPAAFTVVARAVLHHHERADGSGYPYGLTADAISPLGRVLAVAELVGSAMKRRSHASLLMLLRLNLAKFDPAVITTMIDILGPARYDETPVDVINPLRSNTISLFVAMLDSWHKYDKAFREDKHLHFLARRMDHIRALLAQIGMDPHEFNQLADLAEGDATVVAELLELRDETRWLIVDMKREIHRRLPELETKIDARAKQLVHDWLADISRYLEGIQDAR